MNLEHVVHLVLLEGVEGQHENVAHLELAAALEVSCSLEFQRFVDSSFLPVDQKGV